METGLNGNRLKWKRGIEKKATAVGWMTGRIATGRG